MALPDSVTSTLAAGTTPSSSSSSTPSSAGPLGGGSCHNGGGGIALSAGGTGGPSRTASLFACVVTLSNTLLGVSVVGVAGGFSRAGCSVGTLYLLLFAAMAGSGLHLLARCSMTVSAAARRKADAEEAFTGGGGKGTFPPSSFRTVALVGAPRWAFLIDISVALKCFGVATSYLVVIGDLMPTAISDIMGHSHPSDSVILERRFWVTVGFFLAAPLAFSRTLGALKYTATLAIGLVVFLVVMVASFWLLPGLDACPPSFDGGGGGVESFLSFDEVAAGGGGATALGAMVNATGRFLESTFAGENSLGVDEVGFGAEEEACFEGANAIGSVRSILQTMPIFVFCFTCHQNIFTICNEIVHPSPKRVDAVIACAMAVALVVYLSLSWGAYATFGIGVEGDLLEKYPRTGLLTTARICISMLVISCYPLQAHPSRVCILSTWKAFSRDMEDAYSAIATDETAATTAMATSTTISTGSSASSSLPTETIGYTIVSTGGISNQGAIYRNCGPSSGTGREGGGGLVSRSNAGGSQGGGDSSGSSGSSNGSSSGRMSTEGQGRVSNERGGGVKRRGGGGRASGSRASPRSSDNNGGGGSNGGRGRDKDVEAPLENEGLLSDTGSSDLQQFNRAGGGASRPLVDNAAVNIVVAVAADAGGGGGAACPGSVLDCSAEKEAGHGCEKSFWSSAEGFRHTLVTGVFLVLSYAIAMAVNDLGVILEVVGATGSTTIAFILPGLLYLKVHPEPHPKRSLAALQLAAGLLIIPVALTFIALGDSPE